MEKGIKMNYKELSERQVFNLIKNGGMDLDQFIEYLAHFEFVAQERYREMQDFYEEELG